MGFHFWTWTFRSHEASVVHNFCIRSVKEKECVVSLANEKTNLRVKSLLQGDISDVAVASKTGPKTFFVL